MDSLWLLKGPHEAPGWGPLEKEARSGQIDVLLFDRDGWALLRAKEPPTQYEGLLPGPPPDGLYLDNSAHTVYVSGGQQVENARAVLAALGPQAQQLLGKLGDRDLVLERLGRAY